MQDKLLIEMAIVKTARPTPERQWTKEHVYLNNVPETKDF